MKWNVGHKPSGVNCKLSISTCYLVIAECPVLRHCGAVTPLSVNTHYAFSSPKLKHLFALRILSRVAATGLFWSSTPFLQHGVFLTFNTCCHVLFLFILNWSDTWAEVTHTDCRVIESLACIISVCVRCPNSNSDKHIRHLHTDALSSECRH